MVAIILAGLLGFGPPFLTTREAGATDAQEAEVAADLVAAWAEFSRILGARESPVSTAHTDSVLEAHVVVSGETRPYSALTWSQARFANPGTRVYWPVYSRYPRDQRVRVLIHELFHFYYDLPDQYGYGTGGVALSEPDPCVMGNFFTFGWAGRLCPSCLARVLATPRSVR